MRFRWSWYQVIAGLAAAVLLGASIQAALAGQGKKPYPEITRIISSTNQKQQAADYTTLIRRVGPEQAQEALKDSGLPYSGLTHLLNHTVGDYIYEHYGASGLSKCRDYFLSSCYHGFILHYVGGDNQTESVRQVIEHCQQQPERVIVQCSHALGHGVLALLGYKNLPSALQTCDTLAVQIPGIRLIDCYDGVFMENVFGIHDGKPSPDRWVNPNNFEYPCNAPEIAEKYREGCWRNQTVLLYNYLEGNTYALDQQCAGLQNQDYQLLCYNGISRLIQLRTKDDIPASSARCHQLSGTWPDFCMLTIGSVSFALGDRAMMPAICKQSQGEVKQRCYNNLFGSITNFLDTAAQRNQACFKITDYDWRAKCLRYVAAKRS